MAAPSSAQSDTWRVWNKDDLVEQRTYQRVTGELPEMESTKQLVELVGEIYEPGLTVLDAGCAAGHYYNGLQRLDPELSYTGVDATVRYIDFAKAHFKDNPHTRFEVGDLFDLDPALTSDIVYCCNVLLHLPDFRVPLQNLLKVTRKYLFVRTLIGDHTSLNRFLYTDSFDEAGQPTDFVHQNTYSFELLRSFIAAQGDYDVELIADSFEAENITKEYSGFKERQSAVTRVVDGKQIAGNVVFEWQWLKVTAR